MIWGPDWHWWALSETVFLFSFLPLVVFLLSGAIAFSTGNILGNHGFGFAGGRTLSVIMSGDPLVFVICMGAVLDGGDLG